MFSSLPPTLIITILFFCDLPQKSLHELQMVQNSAAWDIFILLWHPNYTVASLAPGQVQSEILNSYVNIQGHPTPPPSLFLVYLTSFMLPPPLPSSDSPLPSTSLVALLASVPRGAELSPALLPNSGIISYQKSATLILFLFKFRFKTCLVKTACDTYHVSLCFFVSLRSL